MTMSPNASVELRQVSFVVRDIKAAERFFEDTVGARFWPPPNERTIRARQRDGTYYGDKGDWEIELCLACVGETQLELIQHLAGRSIFKDFLDLRGEGVQHIAYVVSDHEYDKAASGLVSAGCSLIQGFCDKYARVRYFDTYQTTGIATELIRLTPEGVKLFASLKRGDYPTSG